MKAYFEMLLRRKNAILIQPNHPEYSQTDADKAVMVAGLFNLQSLGFVLSPSALQALSHCAEAELAEVLGDAIRILKEAIGADKEYNVMYPNFPQQVADASCIELFFNAILHYYSFGQWVPVYAKEARAPLDPTEFKTLRLAAESEVDAIVLDLLLSNTNLSPQDLDDIALYVHTCPDPNAILPDEIPMKETAAVVCALLWQQTEDIHPFSRYIHTATDVLRLVSTLTDGNASLSGFVRIRNLHRNERRMVMDLLCGLGYIVEDMYRYRDEWLRVGETVHPGEFRAERYARVRQAFDVLRNGPKPRFFNAKVELCLQEGDVMGAVECLCARPGEFARRLDKLLRLDPAKADAVLDAFEGVADQVATALLLHVREHFARRQGMTNRLVMPKSADAHCKVLRDPLPEIDDSVCHRLVTICESALGRLYAVRPAMGKVYVAPSMKKYIVPFSQRSAGATFRQLTRGSHVAIDDATKVVRAFIWWTNMPDHSRVDIDLSAVVYDENWEYVGHVSFTQLRDSQFKMYHSGDVINGGDFYGEGVSEFLDVDIDALRRGKGRYVMFCVYSYTGQRFADMQHAAFGWMRRDGLNTGEVYEPATVDNRMSLLSRTNEAIPVVLDCETREFVWVDMNMQNEALYNCVESSYATDADVGACVVDMPKPNMYDLVVLNARARGELVEDKADADIIFDVDNADAPEGSEAVFVSPYDIEYFMAELL